LKKLTFAKLFWTWFILDAVVIFLNGMTLRHPLITSIVHSSIGIFLVIHPVWPKAFEQKFSEDQCHNYMRIIGAMQILMSFLMTLNF